MLFRSNHVLMHQTIIGQEAMLQMEMAGDDPDVIVGCTGGGSNFAGIAFPFIGAGLRGGKKPRIIAVEPAACPSLTRGKYAYDFGDTGKMTPLTKMHTLGSAFVPPGFHAGGLRYHGMAPLVSQVVASGLAEARAYPQLACFEAGLLFAKAEGILPAPEANHAVRAMLDAYARKTSQETIPDALERSVREANQSVLRMAARLGPEEGMGTTLVAAVARIFQPGCKVDTALILQGPQGFGKSTFFRTLAGSDWFDDSMGAATGERDERLKLHRA